jgi:4-diphosphocytidyl-2C-methyl-D-erythritol kinase
MSGSGPTLFGVFDTEAGARAVASHLVGIQASVVRGVDVGVEKVQAG